MTSRLPVTPKSSRLPGRLTQSPCLAFSGRLREKVRLPSVEPWGIEAVDGVRFVWPPSSGPPQPVLPDAEQIRGER